MIPRYFAQVGKRFFPPGLWEGAADRPWVALTFDDGPDPDITARILASLAKAKAPAAFFLVGGRAARSPELVRRIHGDGHEVGNHTWSHVPLSLGACLSPERQLARTEELLARLCPGSPRLFRPPFGAIGPGGAAALARQRLTPVYWSVVPGDWNPLPAKEVVRRVVREVHPGAVVVLHGGRPWHEGTVLAVEALVASLRDRGYEIVPVSRMLREAGHRVEARV